MKMKFKSIVAMVLCLVTMIGLLAGPASAATANPVIPSVRVNGELVVFPDAQPFGDENNRTLIPVRFVTEEMGADVSWDQANMTAIIKKSGITVKITIGKQDIQVIKNGKTTTVTMDTVAVGKDGRTFVPIRFVAEALGAYVDYAAAYQTVGIYCDGSLTASEIETLRSYAMNRIDGVATYEIAKKYDSATKIEQYYGPADKRDAMVGNFENAHEFLYSNVDVRNQYNFDCYGGSQKTLSNTQAFEDIVKEAIYEIEYTSERVKVTFRTDTSCVYQPDAMSVAYTTVRGILTVEVFCLATQLSKEETLFITKTLGLTQVGTPGNPVTYLYDAHMKTGNDVVFYGNSILEIIK